MQGQILVTPEELVGTATEFQTQGGKIQELTGQMMTIVTGLSSSWEGEASNAYIQKFKGLDDDIQKMIRMINEHVQDLQDMAEIYSRAEEGNIEDISGLVSDVIV